MASPPYDNINISYDYISRDSKKEDRLEDLVRDLAAVIRPEAIGAFTARVFPLRGGRSPVRKYRVDYSWDSAPGNFYRYTIRVHRQSDGAKSASSEIAAADQLYRQLAGYFSHRVPLQKNWDHIVIYRYTDDEFRDPMVPFDTQLRDWITDSKWSEISKFVESLRRATEKITHAYAQVGKSFWPDDSQWNPTAYLNEIAGDLPPTLLVEVERPLLNQQEFPYLKQTTTSVSLIVDPGEWGDPRKICKVEPDDFVRRFLKRDAAEPNGWFQTEFQCLDALPFKGGSEELVKLRHKSSEVWIHVLTGQSGLRPGAAVEVAMHTGDRNVRSHREALAERGFGADFRCPDREELRQSITDLHNTGHQLPRAYRHTDMHAGNLLISTTGENLKVIDLGDMKLDLRLADAARLEVSLWYELAERVGIDGVKARQTLDWLEHAKGDELEPSTPMWALGTVLSALRQGTNAGSVSDGVLISRTEETIAYASQVLFWLQYSLLPTAGPRPSLAFQTVADYWLRRLDNVGEEADQPDLVTASSDGVKISTGTSIRTLAHLWEVALREPTKEGGELIPTPQMEMFINFLSNEHPQLTQLRLTPFQVLVFNRCIGDDPKTLMTDTGHLILAGPTSCGKSTVAEIFLAHAALSQHRLCGLYIAPTRALAQQKHRDLLRLFNNFDPSVELSPGVRPEESWADRNILLSTGEDTTTDFRIAHGKFSIACMVYEKANILFSRSKGFLSKLGCIVVDEFHMISDIQRGPVLELALAKAVRYRKEEKNVSHPRIIAISTEGASFSDATRFLSVSVSPLNKTDPAEIISSNERPVIVEHKLLLPHQDGNKYAEVDFLTFERTSERVLTSEQLKEKIQLIKGAKMATLWDPGRARRDSMEDRLETLLRKISSDNSKRGHRVLVFVPTKRLAEDLARALAQERNAQKVLCYRDRLNAVAIKSDEDRDTASTVVNCAGFAVFVHHSDISQDLRREIEGIASDPAPKGEVHVLFATETLKYGVNLAINDVIMFGCEFYKSPRKEKDATDMETLREPLDSCSFHNMVGRAGRLGKFGRGVNGNVFILVPDKDNPYTSVIQRYYTQIPPAESALFVEDDYRVLFRHEDEKVTGEQERPIRAADFSPPFVVAVLDSLRHLCMRKGNSYANDHFVRCEELELLTFLHTHTFFAKRPLPEQQGTSDPVDVKRVRELFNAAVRTVLQDLKSNTLRLVKCDEVIGTDGDGAVRWYTITQRGDAIIDTGTEIATLQPMLELATQLYKAWDDIVHDQSGNRPLFPVEVLLLCVLAQKELYRDYLRKMPEMTDSHLVKWTDEAARDNRQDMLDAIVDGFVRLGIAEPTVFADRVRNIIEGWQKTHVFDLAEKYEFGQADSTLRMFAAMLKWVNGDEFNIVKSQIERGRVIGKEHRKLFTSFRTFKEQVAWKVRCLASMLETSDLPLPVDERRLYQLENRVRNGCADEAIPLIHRVSNLKRQQVKILVEQGFTAESILRRPPGLLVEKIPDDQMQKLRADLERYAIEQIKNLHTIWTARKDLESDEDIERLHQLWNAVCDDLFPKAVTAFAYSGTPAVVSADLLLVHGCDVDSTIRDFLKKLRSPVWATDRNAKITGGRRGTPRSIPIDSDIHEEKSQVVVRSASPLGFDLLFENVREAGESVAIRFVAAEFTHQGTTLTRDNNPSLLANLLAHAGFVTHLCVVAFPWLPHDNVSVADAVKRTRDAGTKTVMFLSPAAFLITLMLLKRGILDAGNVLGLLTGETSSREHDYLTTENLLRVTKEFFATLPKLRESLLGYFGG